MLDRMAELQKLWDDALVDAAKVKVGNGSAVRGDQREQHQSRKKVERDEQKRYNKRSRYSESETLFLQWANGPSPAGETKRFTRFGEHRFYEKSVSGCVEITASQYAERRGVNNADDYRRAYHRIDAAAHNDGSEEKRDFRDRGSHGNNGDAKKISRQAVGEELRHDAGGSLSSVDRDGGRDNVKEQFSLRERDDVVSQEITSAKTSIKQVAGLFKDKNAKFGKTNIDVGGGRFNLVTDYLAERGTKNMVFDPYNRGADENAAMLPTCARPSPARVVRLSGLIARPERRPFWQRRQKKALPIMAACSVPIVRASADLDGTSERVHPFHSGKNISSLTQKVQENSLSSSFRLLI